jgi:hypothetical protein
MKGSPEISGVVDPDAVLPLAIARQSLQSRTRRHPQIVDLPGCVEDQQRAERDALERRPKLPYRLPLEQPLGVAIPKALDHGKS